jgi:NADH-quinone oxidoreductase subunit M
MFIYYWLLYFIIWIIIVSFLISSMYTRVISYYLLAVIFLLSLFMIIMYNKSIVWYQIIFKFYDFFPFYINNIIGIDGISIFFLTLCIFLLLHCLFIYWYLRYKINLYCFLLLSVLWLLINLFSSLDLLLFYIYFEGVAIPMFLLIVYEVVVVEKFTLRIIFYIYVTWFCFCIDSYNLYII